MPRGDDLKDEKLGHEVAHANLSEKRWTSERLKIIDERLERIHPDRGIDVLLLCGGMGACLLAIYNVGIKIELVMNWETNVGGALGARGQLPEAGHPPSKRRATACRSPSSDHRRRPSRSRATSTLR